MIKRLLIILLLFASGVGAQAFDPRSGRNAGGYYEMTYSATPVFPAAQNAIFKIILTGNVTSSTITNPSPGQYLRFVICQDATGSRTFVWPASFVDGPTIHTTASACQLYIFTVEATTTIRFVPTVGPSGGGGAVSSVFGRTGAVTAAANDYAWGDISGKPAIAASMTSVSAKWLNSYDAATGLFTQTQPDYSNLTGIPSTFAPSAHTHAIADTTGLQTALDGKQASGSYEAPLTFNAPLSRTANAVDCVAASGSVAGCLSAANWTTFNGKQAALGFTPANSTLTLTASSPLTGGGDLSTNRSFGCQTASGSQAGCLASADWTTFNNKQAALGFTPENSANKGGASGYASLDAGTKIPIAQIPTGSTASTVTIGNDARLSDARTPLAHNHVGADINSGTVADARLSTNVSLLGQTIGGAELDNPAAGVKGGVSSLTCGGTDKLSAIGTNGVPVCSTDQTSAGGPMVSRLIADTGTSATNTLITTGMTFSIAATTNYSLECNIIFTVSTTAAVGLTLGVNGPGTPTQVSLMRQINTTATAFRVDSSQTATWAAKVGATATTVTALSRAVLTGTIENGSTAGTLDIQFANIGTTGTTVVKRGSSCRLQ